MYTRQQIFSLRLTTLNLTVMDIATQPQVGRQAVGSDGAARLDSLSDKPVQAGARQIGDAAQPDAANAFPILLSGHDNQGFFFRSSSTNTGFLTAPVGFVHFNHTHQPVAAWPDPGPTQLVQDRARGFVAAQTQRTLQSQGADAVLLVGDIPHGSKPSPQQQVAVLKDGARRDRYFIPATPAPPAIPPNLPSLSSLAPGTSPTARPAQPCKVFSTGLFIVKASFQFHQSPRIIFDHDPEHYRLWSVASSKYPPIKKWFSISAVAALGAPPRRASGHGLHARCHKVSGCRRASPSSASSLRPRPPSASCERWPRRPPLQCRARAPHRNDRTQSRRRPADIPGTPSGTPPARRGCAWACNHKRGRGVCHRPHTSRGAPCVCAAGLRRLELRNASRSESCCWVMLLLYEGIFGAPL